MRVKDDLLAINGALSAALDGVNENLVKPVDTIVELPSAVKETVDKMFTDGEKVGYDAGFEAGQAAGGGGYDTGFKDGQIAILEDSKYMRGTASGELVSLKDVSPVEHTVAASVESKNIVEFPYAQSGTITLNGVSFTVNDDGTITVNGSPARATYYHLRDVGVSDYDTFAPIENGTYTFSGCPTGGSASTYKLQFNYFTDENATRKYIDDLGSGKQVVINGTAPRYDLWIVLYEGFTADNLVFKPQVEKGTTATPYTPYMADTSAAKIQVLGKNLIDCGTVEFTGAKQVYTRTMPALPVGTYTFSAKVTSGDTDGAKSAVYFVEDDGSTSGKQTGRMLERGARASATFTATAPVVQITLYAGVNYPQSQGDTAMFEDCQLERGASATEYEPYKPLVEYSQGEAVKSIHPTMNIMTDTEGASVDVEYLRDIDAYIDSLVGAAAVMTLEEV